MYFSFGEKFFFLFFLHHQICYLMIKINDIKCLLCLEKNTHFKQISKDPNIQRLFWGEILEICFFLPKFTLKKVKNPIAKCNFKSAKDFAKFSC